MFKMFIYFNKVSFWFGVAWCLFWFFLSLFKVGEMTSGPSLITLWDALWIPFIVSVFPFIIGMSVGLKRRQ